MKILAFAHRSNFSGGANRSLLSVLKGLKERGHTVVVVLPQKKGDLNDALTEIGIKWIYCRYYRMGAKSYYGIGKFVSYAILYSKLIQQYLVSLILEREIKNEKYDIIYTNTIAPYVGLFIGKRIGVPCVIHDRDSLDRPDIIKIKNHEKFLYNHASKIIVISKALKQQWQSKGYSKKIVMINNGIPLAEVCRAEQHRDNRFNILLTARISRDKHHEDAIDAIGILHQEGINDIYLYFAGQEGEKRDKAYKKELKRYIQSKGLSDKIRFLGEVSDMPTLRSKMNVELMCNPDEPFGRVTVEGMRSGLVVIGANAGGTQDIIDDKKTGLFYRAGDPLDLADKIYMVYKDPDLRTRIGNEAYNYANHHFTVEENVDKIETVMEECIFPSRHKKQGVKQ